MNVGVIADVHGSLDGLQRALRLLRDHGCELIVCAGDLVDKGDAQEAVVALMREQEIPCVQGNHDRDAGSTNDEALQIWLREYRPNHPQLDKLSAATRAYLRELPLTRRFTFDQQTLLLAHGVPWNCSTYLFPIAMPKAFRRVAEEAGADVVILGHTHTPMIAAVNDVLIVNPGSVYHNYEDNTRTCAILTLPEKRFTVYDLDRGQLYKPEYVRVKPTDR